MKKFPFLLLDAGPIIKLFELGIWEEFIKKCDVTVSRIVANQAKYASQEFEDICIDLERYEEQSRINILDVGPSVVKSFHDRFDTVYKAIVHDGEKETLAILCNSSENWLVCAADKAVFRILGLFGKANQGISLEEALKEIGLSRELEWKYTKRFREKYTRLGRIDSVHGKGLL
jgi:hypothetical protein